MYNERSQRGVFSAGWPLTTFRKDVSTMADSKYTQSSYHAVHQRLQKIERGGCRAGILSMGWLHYRPNL
jgi:hypothetical protein